MIRTMHSGGHDDKFRKLAPFLSCDYFNDKMENNIGINVFIR